MVETRLHVGKYRVKAFIHTEASRIWIKFGFHGELKDEIKAMDGARWHPEPGPNGLPKWWWVKNNGRNRFQLAYLMGQNPYAPYDRPLLDFETKRPLYSHQKDMARAILTYHYVILAAEMGTGKTLTAIEFIEQTQKGEAQLDEWWFIAPHSALRAVTLEFQKWGLKSLPVMYTYEGLVKVMSNWPEGKKAPRRVVFDECSRIKTPTAKRSQAAFGLAEGVRADWGENGYVVLMSGTPAPKAPTDWWHLCEVTCPGFLKEGTFEKFKRRLGLIVDKTNLMTGGMYPHLVTWLDDERKCQKCGRLEHEHAFDIFKPGEEAHVFQKSKNEISFLYERMKGLVTVKFKKDCLDLPDKIYKIIECPPNDDTKRAAKLIGATAPSAIKALTMLRELSDGFQYIETVDGEETCPKCNGKGEATEYFDPENPDVPVETIDPNTKYESRVETCSRCGGSGKVPRYIRTTEVVNCPKIEILKDLLDEHSDNGRFVVYAGFTGSIDRICSVARGEGWNIIRIDGRGWQFTDTEGNALSDDPLVEFQDGDKYEKICVVGHPESGGMGLTLTRSRGILFYSNDFKADNRMQAEDRIHRPSMDINKGATIYDIIHLPSDRLILENLQKKKDLQNLSMGLMKEVLQ